MFVCVEKALNNVQLCSFLLRASKDDHQSQRAELRTNKPPHSSESHGETERGQKTRANGMYNELM